MAAMQVEAVLGAARTLFREAYEGPPHDGSWFVNVDPSAGVFGTIASLSPSEASVAVTSGGRSIAAHVEHLRWSLAAVNDVLRGKPWQPDWSASWSIQDVTARQWDDLREGLRREYDRLLEALDAGSDWTDPMKLTGVLALPAHAAHHLGTIRQMSKIIRSDSVALPIQ